MAPGDLNSCMSPIYTADLCPTNQNNNSKDFNAPCPYVLAKIVTFHDKTPSSMMVAQIIFMMDLPGI
jgi:hypothetical protein